jgi:arylsulfatase A
MEHRMKIRTGFGAVFLGTWMSLYATPSVATAMEASLPNVVLIFADDLGFGDLGCYGATKIQTPNIDKLATEGRRFTDAHSASAVCSPSRYGILTGEYPFRGDNGKGYWGPCSHFQSLMISTNKLTLPQLFKNKGYATAAFGKWHLGFGTGKTDWNKPLRPGPLDLGFDTYFGVPKVNSGYPFVYVEDDHIVGYDPNDPITFKKPYSKTTTYGPEAGNKSANKVGGARQAHAIYDDEKTAALLVEKAVTWINENKENPFFLYFPTTNIHHPFTPSPQFKGSSQCGLYGDFVEEFDWMVGEIVQCLEENGLADNTLVIVTSDNGGMFNRGGQDAFKAGHRQNGHLLGFKFGVWEGGQRVPFVAKWPGKIPAGTTSKQLISGVDMLATFAALTGQTVEKKQLADSLNVLPALVGEPASPLRDTLVLCPNKSTHLSIRKGKWVFIPKPGSGGFKGKPGSHGAGGPACAAFVGSENSDFDAQGKAKKDAPPAQLYDLEADVNQTKNLYNEYPEVVQEMKALLASYRPANEKKSRGNKK